MYQRAVVTSKLVIPVINQLSLFKSEISSHGWIAVDAKLAALLRVDKATLPSLISFHVAQSNIATSQSVLLAGQDTSQLQLQLSPLGIQKFNIALVLVQEFVTVAELPAGSVVVVPTATVAHAQVSHLAPCGMVKSNTAADEVQELVTLALLHGVPVVVLHTVIVAAAPSSQSFQGVHGVHGSHFRFLY